MEAHVSSNQRIWVKSESGNVYYCPVGALKDPKNATEEQLRQFCIDDSLRPDNS